jgi:uncharacterized protein
MRPLSLADLAATVERESTSTGSALHGPRHWKRVAIVGSRLADLTAGVDPLVVALFALFHDSRRLHDGRDREHGDRGARLALHLCHEWIAPLQLDKLLRACRLHDAGRVSRDDPTIGACWDADRLNLWRVGIAPNPRLLSLAPARDPQMIRWAKNLQADAVGAWRDVLEPQLTPAEATNGR